jgi:beta-glucosidase
METHSSFSRRRFVQLVSGASVAASSVRAEDRVTSANDGDLAFPKGFIWGAATAAYQIEGAAAEDGRGPSVWDVFSKQPGAVWRGNTGDVACDHYHRYREDIGLMKGIGLQAYRMSMSWSRVIPEGTGRINEKGFDFYQRVVDELLKTGIQPWITLYHWDLPQALQEKGGWLSGDSPKWFEEYTRAVMGKLSDRVSHWITFNEPQVFIELGYRKGEHAPGLRLSNKEVLLAAHHVLLAHGRAVSAIRETAKTKPSIGWVLAHGPGCPASEAAVDIEAARRMTLSTENNLWGAAWWTDPIVFGRYPEQGLKVFGGDVPSYTSEEMKVIQQPIDFLGLNIYQGYQVRAKADGTPEKTSPPQGPAQTSFRWSVTPESLRWGPRFLYENYKLPIVITENGMSNCDWVQLDGRVNDPQRIDFLDRYLGAYRQAIADGVDARGYFLWSLLDNYEWAEGYRERFGIIHVDYQTQKRTPKESSKWYHEVIASHGRKVTPFTPFGR